MKIIRLASWEERVAPTFRIASVAVLLAALFAAGALARSSRRPSGAPTPLTRLGSGAPAEATLPERPEAPASATLLEPPEACLAGDYLACRAVGERDFGWVREFEVHTWLPWRCDDGDMEACVAWGVLEEADARSDATVAAARWDAILCASGNRDACARVGWPPRVR